MNISVRNFEFADVPKLSKILKKMELKEALKNLFSVPSPKSTDTDAERESKKKKAEETGAEFGAIAILNIAQAENEIYEFISGLTSLEVEEVKKLDINDMINLFTEFGKKAGDLVSFFKSAAK